MKKYLLPFLMMAVLPFAFLSCKKDNKSSDDYSYVYLNTLPADEITPISAKLWAEVKFHNFTASGTMGLKFYYCQSDTPVDRYDIVDLGDVTAVQTLDIKDGNYSFVLEGLKPGKDYYFMPHLSVMGVSLVSEVKHFKTQDFCVTLEVKNVTANSATVDAMAVLTAEQKAGASVGIQWTTTDFDDLANVHREYIDVSTLPADGSFHYDFSGLAANKQYWVRAFVSLDGDLHPANKIGFKTLSE